MTAEMAAGTHLNKRKIFCLSKRNNHIILNLSGTVGCHHFKACFGLRFAATVLGFRFLRRHAHKSGASSSTPPALLARGARLKQGLPPPPCRGAVRRSCWVRELLKTAPHEPFLRLVPVWVRRHGHHRQGENAPVRQKAGAASPVMGAAARPGSAAAPAHAAQRPCSQSPAEKKGALWRG